MIPILYDKTETAFTSNGIGRLRDCLSCIVTEERNGIYECDFTYPMDGANYELIQVGRIIGVTHDESGDVQPFDIVGFEKPIEGIVTFHCVHVSYRQTRMTVTGSNINSLSDAFTLFGNAQPSNPFTYWTDKTSTGFLASANGIPHSVREMLGGIEGSVLDAYGGEYEWDKWTVKLWSSRGQYRDFSIRYGVNMLSYDDEYDSQSSYSSCIPYWTDGTNTVIGARQDSGTLTPTGRDECVPLDVSEKFEEQPTQAQVEAAGLSYMSDNNTYNPQQTIKVSFVRLQDMGEFADYQNLLQCKLCDTIKVIFPGYNSSGNFKIVKTVWNVLTSKYEEMELGDLSVTLAQALNVSSSSTYVGSGGAGTTNYNELTNKPSVNGVTLSGNKTTSDLSIHDIPSGGTTGQVLAKNSETNYDVGWVNQSGGGGSDYIVEQGTSGIWTYRKWNSGIAEFWGYYSKTVSIPASGQTAITPPSFPFTVTNGIVNATGGGSGNPNVFVTYQTVLSTGTGTDIYWRNLGGSAFNKTAWVYMSVKGTWK